MLGASIASKIWRLRHSHSLLLALFLHVNSPVTCVGTPLRASEIKGQYEAANQAIGAFHEAGLMD
jgi:hypothetical protein